MAEPFVGSEAIASGALTRSQLGTGYSRLFRDVYVDRDIEVTAALRAKAGWLWTKRQGVVAGISAAALHGSRWVEDTTTVELLHGNRHRLAGLHTRGDRIEDDEITVVDGVPVTTPARTVLDLGWWYPITSGVAAIDSLARATEFKAADVELLAQRYPGRRGITRARLAITLFDAGAEFGSPIAYLDMGWEDVKVAVEYDGDQHRSDRSQYGWDIRRLEILHRLGWVVIRVVAGDRPANIVRRVKAALAGRV